MWSGDDLERFRHVAELAVAQPARELSSDAPKMRLRRLAYLRQPSFGEAGQDDPPVGRVAMPRDEPPPSAITLRPRSGIRATVWQRSSYRG